jgi:hypothetical protein
MKIWSVSIKCPKTSTHHRGETDLGVDDTSVLNKGKIEGGAWPGTL